MAQQFTMAKQFSGCLLRQFAKKKPTTTTKNIHDTRVNHNYGNQHFGDIKSCPPPYLSWEATAHLVHNCDLRNDIDQT